MKYAAFFPTYLVVAAFAAVSAQGPRSVWDGVYTAEQAMQGEKLATARCVLCHGDRLTGGELAPALSGDVFSANWDGVMLGDLVDRIRKTMPVDSPGTLSRQQTVDIVAYILSLGQFPAGAAPLPTDAGVLTQIKFESIKPQR